MQVSQKSLNRQITPPSGFKKKQLKKKISECIHICQCGRQFLSFPAVYSHAKTKHNFKISSRIGDQGRKLVQKDSQIRIFYQINNSELLDMNSEQQSQERKESIHGRIKQSTSKFNFINKIRSLETSDGRKNIYAVMIEFLNDSTKQFTLDGINFTADTLDLLSTCVNQHYMHFDSKKVQKDYCSENTAENIPYYFNFFLVWYLPSKENQIMQNMEKVEALLKIFFIWLREHQYTTLDDQSLRQLKSYILWKSYFIKSQSLSSEQKDHSITKKSLKKDLPLNLSCQ